MGKAGLGLSKTVPRPPRGTFYLLESKNTIRCAIKFCEVTNFGIPTSFIEITV